MRQAPYLGIISEDEVEKLRAHYAGGRRHSLLALIDHSDDSAWLLVERAARDILDKNAPWLTGLKTRLLATDDYTHASGALGEIRAYGALLKTWMDVKPGPKVPYSRVSPEFGVDGGDGSVIVEVHTRQLDNAEAEALKQHDEDSHTEHKRAMEAKRSSKSDRNTVTISEHEVFPTGAPDPKKKGDSWVTNTISRISRIKEEEKQIDANRPFVLWLDLHDSAVWGFRLDLEFFQPVFSDGREGGINSGPLWFALYGKKGDPLLHSRGWDYRADRLLHDGRFFQTMKSHGGPTRVSAVVYSSTSATMLMENPNAEHAVPARFRAAILKVPNFCLDRSVMEWRRGLVQAAIAHNREMVFAATEALTSFDALGEDDEQT